MSRTGQVITELGRDRSAFHLPHGDFTIGIRPGPTRQFRSTGTYHTVAEPEWLLWPGRESTLAEIACFEFTSSGPVPAAVPAPVASASSPSSSSPAPW